MFQKKQIIYSETLGVCVVDNIVSLAASKREKAVPYYVLKPVFEDKVSYIPVEHHRVVLRDMFTGEEALKLKETEQYEKDKHLRQAVDYVLDKVAIKYNYNKEDRITWDSSMQYTNLCWEPRTSMISSQSSCTIKAGTASRI